MGNRRCYLLIGNRHPADELADTRAEIRRLEEREQELRTYLLEHPHDRIGAEFTVTIGEKRRRHVDLQALASEIGHSLLQRFTSFICVVEVRLRQRKEDAA
jgi:hypothetical protein